MATERKYGEDLALLSEHDRFNRVTMSCIVWDRHEECTGECETGTADKTPCLCPCHAEPRFEEKK